MSNTVGASCVFVCFIDGVRPEIIGCSDGSIQYQVRASNQVCHVCVPYGSALSLWVWSGYISTTNLAACVSVQNLTNFCPYALISTPNVPKILFA